MTKIPLTAQLEDLFYKNGTTDGNYSKVVECGLMAAVLDFTQRAADLCKSGLDYKQSGGL